MIFNKNQIECDKCSGDGWLWRDELDTYEADPDFSFDDTKYICDNCNGEGFISISKLKFKKWVKGDK